jgi:CRISPR-associated endonuclease Csn1
MNNFTLGIDLGPNSIGWALVDQKNEKLISGVRVFPEGVERDNAGLEKSRNVQRREARSARRQHNRKSRRKMKLRNILNEAGLLTEEDFKNTELMALNPYELRAQGITSKLKPAEFARALMHINQRRGFKSNRKADTKKETGKVYEEIAGLANDMKSIGARTLGEYLHLKYTNGQKVRDRYTLRDMYEREFELLWEVQSCFYPDILTDAAKEKIYQAIFHQRPLKPTEDKIGFCKLERTERRCPIASWFAQRFRLLKTVNDMRIHTPGEIERRLREKERAILIDKLGRTKDIKIDRIRKLLGLQENDVINLELGGRDKIQGCIVEAGLRKIFKNFDKNPRFCIEEVYESLLQEEPEIFEKKAREEWKLSETQLEKLYKIDRPQGYLHYSITAIKKLLPYLEKGDGEYDAIQSAGYVLDEKPEECEKLPLPEVSTLANPIVRKALFELRRVINAIIREYGKPSEIVIELARETRGTQRERNDTISKIRRNEQANEKARQWLKDFGIPEPSRDDIIKYKLWEECGHFCPYTGKPISPEQLFMTGEFQVDHILPHSRSLDDSYMNKILCYVPVNKEKGDRTPYEAFSADPERWERILSNIKRLPRNKQRKFLQKEINVDQFIQRQLNDTRYISREVKKYVQMLGSAVRCTRGQVTAELRYLWGLNTILGKEDDAIKQRDDHRHHAIDAVAIALTNASHLQQLAHKYDFKRERRQFPLPWPNFRGSVIAAVEPIKVSHRVLRKVSGALHEETNYGLTDEKGQYVYRKNLTDLTLPMVNKIRDHTVREIVIERLKEFGIDPDRHKGSSIPKEVFKEPLYMKTGFDKTTGKPKSPVQIKKVRIWEAGTDFIGMSAADGTPYRFVKPGNNHHIEIFGYTDSKGRKAREGVVVSMFDAAQRARKGESLIRRVHPERPDAVFLFSLSRNEMFRLMDEQAKGQLCRVQKMDINQNIILRPHEYAGKMSDYDKPPIIFRRIPNTLIGRKVTIDPLGREFPAND